MVDNLKVTKTLHVNDLLIPINVSLYFTYQIILWVTDLHSLNAYWLKWKIYYISSSTGKSDSWMFMEIKQLCKCFSNDISVYLKTLMQILDRKQFSSEESRQLILTINTLISDHLIPYLKLILQYVEGIIFTVWCPVSKLDKTLKSDSSCPSDFLPVDLRWHSQSVYGGWQSSLTLSVVLHSQKMFSACWFLSELFRIQDMDQNWHLFMKILIPG